MTKDQPVFEFSSEKLPVKAAGVVFYHIDIRGVVWLLMIRSRGRLEDFGGKTDSQDSDYVDTVVRETEEESNEIFSKKFVRSKIEKQKPLYTAKSKYIFYFAELDDKIDAEKFGDLELYENVPRTVEWIDTATLKKTTNQLNFRLRTSEFFKKVSELETEAVERLSKTLEEDLRLLEEAEGDYSESEFLD